MKKTLFVILLLVSSYSAIGQSPRLMIARPPGSKFLLGVISANRHLIATLGENNQVILWDAASGQELYESTYDPSDLSDQSAGANLLKFSPDNRYLVVYQTDGQGASVYLYDLTAGVKKIVISGHLVKAAFSPDSKELTVMTFSGLVSVYRTIDGTFLRKIKNAQAIDYNAMLSDDIETFKKISGGKMPTDPAEKARVLKKLHDTLEVKYKKIESQYDGRPLHPTDSAFLSKEVNLALADRSSVTYFKDFAKLAPAPPIQVFYHAGNFLPDGHLAVNRPGFAGELDLGTGKIFPLNAAPSEASQKEESSQVIQNQSTSDDNDACFTCSPKGTYNWDNSGLLKLASPGKKISAEQTAENTVIDTKSGKVILKLQLHYLDGIVFSQDEKLAAVSYHDAKKIDIYDLKRAQIIKSFHGFIQPATAFPYPIFKGQQGNSYFSPDNSMLVMATDAPVQISPPSHLSTDNAQMPLSLKEIFKLQANGSGLNNHLVVMDVKSGKLISVLKDVPVIAMMAPKFEQNGKLLRIYDMILNRSLLYETSSGHIFGEQESKESANMSVSPDDSLLAKDEGDGIIAISRIHSDKPFLRCIPVSDEACIRITADGYYDLPKADIGAIYFVSADLKPVTFDQLDIRYNRPDRVLEALGSTNLPLITAYKNAYKERMTRLKIDTTTFNARNSIPEVTIVNRNSLEQSNSEGKVMEKINLVLKIRSPGSAIRSLNISVNRDPIFGVSGIPVGRGKNEALDTTMTVLLTRGKNSIVAYVRNNQGAESYHEPLVLSSRQQAVAGKVYFAGIAISQYKDESSDLKYSKKDIREMAGLFKSRYKNQIIIDTFFDEQVRPEILKIIKAKLMSLKETDKVIIAYSGHGLTGADGRSFLSTYETDLAQAGLKSIPFAQFEDLMDGIPPRKKLMLVDACNSGDYDKEYRGALNAQKNQGDVVPFKDRNSAEIMRDLFANVAENNGATIIAATGASGLAGESATAGHSYFSLSVLEALNNSPKSLSLNKLKAYIVQRVGELSKFNQQPVIRSENLDSDWDL